MPRFFVLVLVWGLRETVVSARFWAPAFWSTLEGFRAEIADFWFGHGCSGYRMNSEHERYYRSGMNALVIVCSGNTKVIMV